MRVTVNTRSATATVKHAASLPGRIREAERAAMHRWALDTVTRARAVMPGRTRRNVGFAGPEAADGMWRVTVRVRAPGMWMERGTRPHVITTRRAQGRRARPGTGARKPRAIAVPGVGARASVRHPGIRARWVVRRLITARAREGTRMIRAAVNDAIAGRG